MMTKSRWLRGLFKNALNYLSTKVYFHASVKTISYNVGRLLYLKISLLQIFMDQDFLCPQQVHIMRFIPMALDRL